MNKKIHHFDPWVEERSEEARAKAKRIFDGEYSNFDDVLFMLKFQISRHYNLPIFDPYFSERTFDDLVFELELINLQRMPAEKRVTETVNANKEEAKEIFDDFTAEDDFVDMPLPTKDGKFENIADQFMKTGEFK